MAAMKIYRGAAAAARHYVEADRSRADDYYLAEGSGVAMRFVATPATVRRASRGAGRRRPTSSGSPAATS